MKEKYEMSMKRLLNMEKLMNILEGKGGEETRKMWKKKGKKRKWRKEEKWKWGEEESERGEKRNSHSHRTQSGFGSLSHFFSPTSSSRILPVTASPVIIIIAVLRCYYTPWREERKLWRKEADRDKQRERKRKGERSLK